jgi:hypothetical protein
MFFGIENGGSHYNNLNVKMQKLTPTPIAMPPEDPMNSCLLAVRTLEVELKNSIAYIAKHDITIGDNEKAVTQLVRDIAILRNDLDGFIKIRNYLMAACLAQLVALVFAIPALIFQFQHLSAQTPVHNIKAVK